jgi:hypothetical protein
VVDRGGLENRCTRKGTEGSNPSLSASTTGTRSRITLNTFGHVMPGLQQDAARAVDASLRHALGMTESKSRPTWAGRRAERRSAP